MFPQVRMRRLRRTDALRELIAETHWDPGRLVAPLFVVAGRGVKRPITTLPGHHHMSPDAAAEEARALWDLGIRAVLLFGVIPDEEKDDVGSAAFDPQGPVHQALGAIARATPRMVRITDVCLDEYTSHGHCGVFDGREVHNDATLPLLDRVAVSHAEAGADIVAPSDMMDGRVAHIRAALDSAGFSSVAILAYAAKFASAFYGPFRAAAGSTPAVGDRCGYQEDPRNAREALREVDLDVAEGADLVMVKPAMPYLDIIRRVRERTLLPLVAYQVSGEYAMLESAIAAGLIDGDRARRESLDAIFRAGADLVITYLCRWAAQGGAAR